MSSDTTKTARPTGPATIDHRAQADAIRKAIAKKQSKTTFWHRVANAHDRIADRQEAQS